MSQSIGHKGLLAQEEKDANSPQDARARHAGGGYAQREATPEESKQSEACAAMLTGDSTRLRNGTNWNYLLLNRANAIHDCWHYPQEIVNID